MLFKRQKQHIMVVIGVADLKIDTQTDAYR